MKGVTDALILVARQAETGSMDYTSTLDSLWQRQEEAITDLFGKSGENERWIRTLLEKEFSELREICHGVFLLRECSLRSIDFIMSFGERLNNQLISAYASMESEVFYVDARPLVVSTDSHTNSWTNGPNAHSQVDLPETYKRIAQYFLDKEGIGIVTGFIAASPAGITTTLGRNGSDYSAAIFGAALGAERVEIWTDVDGILEADPAVVPQASVIDELSLDEAMELSYFGAEILHPSTMVPAIENNIPIWIKNTFNPTANGTRIAADAQANPNIITGIASIPDVSLINIIGSGMVGARSTAMNIFSALSKVGINIIMISQASSAHNICLVIRSQESTLAVKEIQRELEYELKTRIIQNITVHKDLEVMAIIGSNMRGRPGVSGRLFKTLGDEGINIFAIAQGSSEMNISFVIDKSDHVRSLKSLHRSFFSAEKKS